MGARRLLVVIGIAYLLFYLGRGVAGSSGAQFPNSAPSSILEANCWYSGGILHIAVTARAPLKSVYAVLPNGDSLLLADSLSPNWSAERAFTGTSSSVVIVANAGKTDINVPVLCTAR